MQFLNSIMDQDAYSTNNEKKNIFFKKYINYLTYFHYKNSSLYKNYLKSIGYKFRKNNSIYEIPFLPVRLFKEFDFLSIKKKDIYKTLFSSGTTSGSLSKIYLDKINALNQIKTLKKIFDKIIGNKRFPMLVIDKKKEVNRTSFNASVAAVNGFSIFASEIIYLLDENDEVNYLLLNKFLKKNKNSKFMIFGFTSNVFLNLIEKIDIKKIPQKSFHKAFLIHGGGWKKMEQNKISQNKFNYLLKKKLGVHKIISYYGLVEQIGSIFFECNCGYFIASNFSDIIIRDKNFNVCKSGEKGFIQLMSLLPTSYPGHSILTEDIGEVIDDKKCKCFGSGKRFLIHGRLQNAELRGCSNI